jgi:hypothetical protein
MMDKERGILWGNYNMVYALLSKEYFDKMLGDRKVVEVKKENIFTNGSIVLWKNTYGYPYDYFKKAQALAKMLEFDIMLFPDSETEFPMFFTDSERTLYVTLAPRILEELTETREFIEKMVKKETI